ncbi:hypothetical protein SDC9_58268 [bioreactor metagenome]|uniref:Uncharacterized protein n=1 Tax=bioreactor metagenome TaxID=1076179 RepID=A0A644X7L2_9ZZZZ
MRIRSVFLSDSFSHVQCAVIIIIFQCAVYSGIFSFFVRNFVPICVGSGKSSRIGAFTCGCYAARGIAVFNHAVILAAIVIVHSGKAARKGVFAAGGDIGGGIAVLNGAVIAACKAAGQSHVVLISAADCNNRSGSITVPDGSVIPTGENTGINTIFRRVDSCVYNSDIFHSGITIKPNK